MKKIIDKLKQIFKIFCEINIINFSMYLKIKKIITFEAGWFHEQEFMIVNFKIFEKIDNDFITLISLHIFKFSISLYWEK